jgi:hypothetical protein
MSRCLLPQLHLRTETDPVSETSCSLEYQTMEKSKNPVILWSIKMFLRATQVLACPLRALSNIHPDVPTSFRHLCSLDPLCMPATHSLTCRFPEQHTLTLLPCLFPIPAKSPPFRASNSCAYLLLVRLVAVWEPSGLILSHGRANENRGSLFHFPPASYIIDLFYPEDGSDMFLRNVGWLSTDY